MGKDLSWNFSKTKKKDFVFVLLARSLVVTLEGRIKEQFGKLFGLFSESAYI